MTQSELQPSLLYPIIGTFTIRPAEIIDFCVGIYESCLPQPCVRVEFIPLAHGNIISSMTRIDAPGEYTLMHHFENVGTATYHVIVRAGWPLE